MVNWLTSLDEGWIYFIAWGTGVPLAMFLMVFTSRIETREGKKPSDGGEVMFMLLICLAWPLAISIAAIVGIVWLIHKFLSHFAPQIIRFVNGQVPEKPGPKPPNNFAGFLPPPGRQRPSGPRPNPPRGIQSALRPGIDVLGNAGGITVKTQVPPKEKPKPKDKPKGRILDI